jgi:DNA uptake protein ComE-like DNA-binding protein
MKLKNAKPYLQFSRAQRVGLAALFTVIIIFQLAYFLWDTNGKTAAITKKAESEWLSVPVVADTHQSQKRKYKIYQCNPNFITDFKGYMLGMSVEEIDRLLAFRKTDRYVNSSEEFQAVTKVSDSLLGTMVPYFKFPDWVKNKSRYRPFQKTFASKPEKVRIDINKATQEDLKKIYGIGDGLSERILKEREKFGGFVSMDQMQDIWGLSDEVIASLQNGFKVGELPEVKKVNINNASIKELSQFPYFKYALAKSIVTYRSMNGKIESVEDLINISGFPVDKIKIIALYLEF